MEISTHWYQENQSDCGRLTESCPECSAPMTKKMDSDKEIETQTCLKCDHVIETDFWDTDIGQQQIYALANKFRNEEGVRI